jgi:hypothetical protein
MTNRDLFHATMRWENDGQLLHVGQGFNVPYKRWYKEGLPAHVVNTDWVQLTGQENLYDYFNVSGFLFSPRYLDDDARVHISQFCVPPYPTRILSDDDRVRVSINALGNTLREISDKQSHRRDDGTFIGSPPYEIDFAIKTPADYLDNRYRYVGNTEKRFDRNWLLLHAAEYRQQQDFISSLFVHGPFAFLRELVGTEMAMVLPYEEPEMVRMILQDHLDTVMAASEEVIRSIRHDASYVWEDCCGSTGPFISPAIFEEQFAWWYREWKDFTKSMGIDWALLDTDGNPAPLVAAWYENGIDCILPWEVNAVDMLKMAENFPNYVMMGGIYKHIFEPNDISQIGKFSTGDVIEAINLELERVLPMMCRRGGYFPSLDHGAHWAISFDAYNHYAEKLLQYGKANQVTRPFKTYS